MSGNVAILAFGQVDGLAVDKPQDDSESPLVCGYTREGSASDSVGLGHWDRSAGTQYAHDRYDYEETAGMAKVRNKSDRSA